MQHNNNKAWSDANQKYLVAAVGEVRAVLEQVVAKKDGKSLPQAESSLPVQMTDDRPPAIEVLCHMFGLSIFERSIVLLCAGIELDASFAGLCSAAQCDTNKPYPTFSLSLAAIPDSHWSAINPGAPLRRWRLVDLVSHGVQPITTSPLKIDERVLHFLTGINYLDVQLSGVLAHAHSNEELVPSHQALAEKVVAVWREPQRKLPAIELYGADEPSRRDIGSAACASVGLQLCVISSELIPGGGSEFEDFLVRWERESALSSSALYINADSTDPTDGRTIANVTRLIEQTRGAIFLSGRDRWRVLERPMLTLEVSKPTRKEQQSLWQNLLTGAANLNGHATHLASQFNLHVPAIRASVRESLAEDQLGDTKLAERLWNAGRAQSRPRLENLAHRIEPSAGWSDLVLPETEMRILRQIVDQVAHRSTVYDEWGFGRLGARGLGISALFCGSSGTGKTLAAEVMAGVLRLDLYRIDLAGMVSKYIGETEKNLRRVFDAAEDGGAILFFDEADALFGKRTEVKDSHDRYANIEINYLLQRMESYRGLAILATNRKGDLDSAFLRRIRFVVNFPFPDAAQRAEIWRCAFPAAVPTERLDISKLSRLNIAGGNIRNIAVQAAFLAAAAGEAVHMRHLAQAASSEFAKLEKPLSDSEIGGWK